MSNFYWGILYLIMMAVASIFFGAAMAGCGHVTGASVLKFGGDVAECTPQEVGLVRTALEDGKAHDETGQFIGWTDVVLGALGCLPQALSDLFVMTRRYVAGPVQPSTLTKAQKRRVDSAQRIYNAVYAR